MHDLMLRDHENSNFFLIKIGYKRKRLKKPGLETLARRHVVYLS